MSSLTASGSGSETIAPSSQTSRRQRRTIPGTLPGALLMLFGLLACPNLLAASAGQVTINDRSFDIADDSSVSIDDDPVTLQQMHERIQTGDGWRSSSNVLAPDATLTSGSISQIKFENNLKGPITSTAPLRVLGQPFSMNGNTVLKGFTDVAELAQGQFLEVSGFVDVDSSVMASRVARDDTSPSPWRISGFITQFDGAASTATIGSAPGGQPISFAGVSPTGCVAGPGVGDYVLALATPIAGFTPGQVIDTVTQLSCRALAPQGTLDDHDAFEGLVESVPDASTFVIAGITVTHDASTLFKSGNADDLAPGVRVEVEGTFTSPTTLAARRVHFILTSIRLRAPVAPADVVPGVSITILGNTVLDSLQDRDEDSIMAGGLAGTTQVEVRAYMDRLGQLFATRVRSRGAPSSNHYNLQAPAETITRPTLTARGLTVDTSASTFTDDNKISITADQFFTAVSVGTLFEIDDAQFNAATGTLSAGVVRLSDDGGAATLKPQTAGPANAQVGGTVSAIALDLVFKNGFE